MPRIKFGEIKDHWAIYIAEHPFQWFATLTFRDAVDQVSGRKKVIEWVRKICVGEHLQVGFIAVENEFNCRGHWHLLMLGRNRFGRDLSKVSKHKWAKRWWEDNCGRNIKLEKGVLIKEVNEIYGVSSYLARNLIVKNPDQSDVFFYNRKLLKKCRLKK
jgi:hypothetical protein